MDFPLEKLSQKKHSELVKFFDCGHKDSNEFLRDAAIVYQNNNLGCTYLRLSEDKRKIITYVTLAVGAIKFKDPELALAINSGEKPNQLPVLKIARIGTALGEQNKGHGTYMLKVTLALFNELKEKVGVRYLLVDAVPDKVVWYSEQGFKPIFTDTTGRATLPMYLTP